MNYKTKFKGYWIPIEYPDRECFVVSVAASIDFLINLTDDKLFSRIMTNNNYLREFKTDEWILKTGHLDRSNFQKIISILTSEDHITPLLCLKDNEFSIFSKIRIFNKQPLEIVREDVCTES